MLQLTRLQLIAYPTKHLPVELPVITFTGLLFAETIPLTSKGSQSTEQTYRSQNDTIPTAINFHAANSRANNRTQTTCHSEIISALVPRTIPFAILAQRTPIVGNANSERGGRLSLQPQCAGRCEPSCTHRPQIYSGRVQRALHRRAIIRRSLWLQGHHSTLP